VWLLERERGRCNEKKKRNRVKMSVNGFKLVYTCHVMNGKFGALTATRVAAKLCPIFKCFFFFFLAKYKLKI
jgi:hypothetical protein